ncbi:hypothetical protein GCM10007977_020020 [Dactylosporangium sucinum]|uniref:Uncharacterized protein n=1 Tax=Dactylosporangium sucinum TaxID=1424081 RepID=A0A917TFF6_9ACTN|nr:hypothetical protein GCM10007977_020020 [Dactylosporangium sucinum]
MHPPRRHGRCHRRRPKGPRPPVALDAFVALIVAPQPHAPSTAAQPHAPSTRRTDVGRSTLKLIAGSEGRSTNVWAGVGAWIVLGQRAFTVEAGRGAADRYVKTGPQFSTVPPSASG